MSRPVKHRASIVKEFPMDQSEQAAPAPRDRLAGETILGFAIVKTAAGTTAARLGHAMVGNTKPPPVGPSRD
jgi:hypothetical protein